MKVVLAQCNFTVGDFEGNAAKILSIYATHSAHVDAVVFSELALSGYYPSDLLMQADFLDAQAFQLDRLKSATIGQRACLITTSNRSGSSGSVSETLSGLMSQRGFKS